MKLTHTVGPLPKIFCLFYICPLYTEPLEDFSSILIKGPDKGKTFKVLEPDFHETRYKCSSIRLHQWKTSLARRKIQEKTPRLLEEALMWATEALMRT